MTEQREYSCQIVCYAEAFDLLAMSSAMLNTGRTAYYRNVLQIELEQGACVVFPFGVVVYWNLRSEVVKRMAEEICTYAREILSDYEVDHYVYRDDCERNRFTHDHIELVDSQPLTLLSISHALAQSTKLSVFEMQAQKTIENTATIPRSLARTGRSSLSRTQASRMRGQLFLTKSEILLKYELLDTPEFFWEYPELQPLYEIGATYLEIRQRTKMLSLKLETIHEMFEMLADDLKHKHSSRLEWIIIWLIAVEIVIFIYNDFIVAH